MNFEESVILALNEIQELNQKEGFYRWKTITMDIFGVWYAYECEKINLYKGKNSFIAPDGFMAPYGKDIMLNVKFNEGAELVWEKCLITVPNNFHD